MYDRGTYNLSVCSGGIAYRVFFQCLDCRSFIQQFIFFAGKLRSNKQSLSSWHNSHISNYICVSIFFMASVLVSKLKRQLPLRRKSMQRFLKKFDKQFVPGISKILDRVSEETWAETNCLACAHCCKVMTPTFTKSDLTRIATHFNMSEKAFYDKWLKTDPDTGDRVNKTQPCQFLDLQTNMCSIYEIRPIDCAQFPHFKRKPFADYNHIHKQNIEYCPATFLFITKLQSTIEEKFVW